jgi:hypothetical protein
MLYSIGKEIRNSSRKINGNLAECVPGSFEGTEQARHPGATEEYATITMYISYSPIEITTGSPS